MEKSFKWGIIGCGGISSKLAKAVDLVEGACVAAAAARDLAKAQAFAKAHHIPKAYGSYEALLADPEIDAVYIGIINPYHFPVAKMALEAKKPVLCEKPLTLNAEEARELAQIAKENDTFLMEAMWTRFIPLYAKLKELVDCGEIGEIRRVEADFSVYNEFDANHRLFNWQMGGGVLIDMGIYPITAAAIFLGDKPEKIVSDIIPASTGVDAQTSIILRYRGDKQAVLTCSILADSPIYLNLVGTKGRIYVEEFLGAKRAIVSPRGKQAYTVDADYGSDNGFEHEVKEVMACVAAGKKESAIMPLSRSIDIMNLMDTVRWQNGLHYEIEK